VPCKDGCRLGPLFSGSIAPARRSLPGRSNSYWHGSSKRRRPARIMNPVSRQGETRHAAPGRSHSAQISIGYAGGASRRSHPGRYLGIFGCAERS
jgi:hypothetical protein